MRTIRTLALVATMLVAARASAAGVDPGHASAAQREDAQTRFSRGKELYESGKYDDAANEFRASSEVVASPNARLYYARALREAGHYAKAYVELGRVDAEARAYASEDSRYEAAGQAARSEQTALRPKLGFVLVHVANAGTDTTLSVGGEQIERSAWADAVPVMPGPNDVVVASDGRTPVRRSVTTNAGRTEDVTIDAGDAPSPLAVTSPPPTESSGDFDRTRLRPYAYVAGGVGVAGLATFVVAGLLTNSTYADLQSQCSGSRCAPSTASEISRGKTEQTIANVGLVGVSSARRPDSRYLCSAFRDRDQP